jgi:hypothetical protein
VQLSKRNPVIASALQRYTSGDSGYLSGSCTRSDDARMLEVKDSFGSVSVVLVCLPGTLVVSSQAPSGCILSSPVRALERSVYKTWGDAWPIELAGAHLSQDVLLLDHRPVVTPRKSPRITGNVSYQQLILQVQETFGLHTTDLADLLQVSRQSVHSWKSEKGSAPGRSSITKLSLLRDAATEWRKAFPSNAPGWLLHSMAQGRTVKSWLILVASNTVTIDEFLRNISPTMQTSTQPKEHRPSTRAPTAFEAFVDSLPSPEPSSDSK